MESTPGAGSIFTIRLPDLPDAKATKKSTTTPIVEAQATILVVDDDATARDLLTRTLEGKGYRVIVARHGLVALALARQHRPKAITLDVMMPQLDGWGVLRQIKEDITLRDIPVIMVTILNERALAIPLGVTELLTKPVDRQRLTALMAQYCNGSVNNSVLVIEDDAATRELLTRLVTGAGYRAASATNGREGLDWLDTNAPPDLILLDLMMPNLDGFGFLGELRRRNAYARLPVVIVTAKHLSEEDLRRLRELHAEIIIKNGDYLDELGTIMRQTLGSDTVEAGRAH